MKNFYLPNKAARLVILQRIELISPFLKRIRKLFGRNFFTNIVTKYFLNSKQIGFKYYEAMQNEFLTFKKYIDFDKDKLFLSIGGGLGGLEIVVNENLPNKDWAIVQVTNNAKVTTTASHTHLGLLVDSGSELEIQNDQLLENTSYLKLDGQLDLVDESQLIQDMGSIVDNLSTGVLERDQQGTTNLYNYNYWTSPVNDGTNTASPGPIPHAIKTKLRASVPFAQVSAYFAPVNSLKSDSKDFTSGPIMYCP